MAELSVKIGADIVDLQKKLSQAIKRLDNLKKAERGLKKAFDDGKISADRYYDAVSKNSLKLTKANKNLSLLTTNVKIH